MNNMVIKDNGAKINIFFVILFLIVSLFAVSVIAQSNDSVNSISVNSEDTGLNINSEDVFNTLESGEIDIVTKDNKEVIDNVTSEVLDEIEKEIEVGNGNSIFGMSQVTIGEGFILNDDESNAEFFKAIWVLKKFVKDVPDTENVSEVKIGQKDIGYVIIGRGDSKERFKVEFKNYDFNSSKIIFDLFNKDKNFVGTLEIKSKRYDRITLWFGTLILDNNSGDYVGTWKVTAVSKSKIIKSKIDRPSSWNIFAFKSRRDAKFKEHIQERLFEDEGFDQNITKSELRRLDNEGEREHSKIKVRRRERKEIRENKRERFKEIRENEREKRKEIRENEKERKNNNLEKDIVRKVDVEVKNNTNLTDNLI